MKALNRILSLAAFTLLFTFGALAQTASLEGEVKGEDGKPLKDALIRLERKDIKGSYKVKTNKKGQWFHAGLPLGTYDVICEVEGKVADQVNGVRTRLGDPLPVNFDLSKNVARKEAMEKAMQTGQVTEEMSREMSKEQREAMEKQVKERAAAMAKNKELNDAFNSGMEALKAKNFQPAAEGLEKAAALDPKQVVIWANLGDAYTGLAATKPAAEQTAVYDKAIDAYKKALELKPDDGGVRNNYGLVLLKAKKFDEAEKECAQIGATDPNNGAKCYFNIGAILTNAGQAEPAGQAFKKAIDVDPNYADAQYQYGIYLVSKAQVSADGKITPPPGTEDAFQKYLQLKPDGPYASSAKSMIESMGSTVNTEYRNPNAPAKKNTKKK